MYFLIVSIAAIIIGIKGGSFSVNGSTRVILSVFGILQAIVMAYLTYEFIEYPNLWGGGNWLAYSVVMSSMLLGITVFLLSQHLNKRLYGIDIAMAYAEIPPE
ncbi:hypothetical protein [Vulcanisaeta distributa]|uniref:hypothetical protein n=1 Tax=Vulcanisaeta distributa TaxID=164451 RepID=UPI001FB2E6BE|nr:hypothetical protein [Vulcanisaeta distributa]